MRKIKYVLFDFDGTIVNSEGFHFDCWNKTLEPFKIKLAQDEYDTHLTGIPNHGNARYILTTYQLSISIDELVTKHELIVQKLYRENNIEFMPFAKEILDWLRAENIRMGLVTGSPREDVDWVFQKTGLEKYFEISITCNDVSQSKPHPESYTKAIEYFSNQKDEFIALEDSANGVASAIGAGITCLGVQSNAAHKKRLRHTDRLFDNLNEVMNYLSTAGWI